jgi:hypothetical protein
MWKYLFLFISVQNYAELFIQPTVDKLHFGDIVYRRWYGSGIGKS